MDETIRVVLADDHPLVRAGMRTILAAEPDVLLVGEATNGYDVQRLCRNLQPDVLLLDLKMPGPPPTQTVADLRHHCPGLNVLILSAYDDVAYVRGMLAAGVVGYVLKDEALEVVVRAIRAVVQGDPWFSRPILAKLRHSETGEPSQAQKPHLTKRELAVLQLMVAGKTDQEISQQLRIGERTVRYCLRHIYEKLEVKTRIEAAVRAVQLALVQE